MEAQAFLFPMEELTFSPEEAPARTSPSPASGGDSPTEPGALSHSSMLDWWESYVPAFSSGRMSLAFFPLGEDATLPPSFDGWTSWGMGSPGGFWTCNGPEWTAPCRAEGGGASRAPSPSDATVCGLSDLLEPPECVPEKYYLSATACRGILRRAEKRGKVLPRLLDIALRSQLKRAEAEEEGEDSTCSHSENTERGGAASTVKARDYKDATDLVAMPTALPPSAPTTAADSADKAPRGGSSPSASASFDGTDCAPTLHRQNGSPGQSDQEIFSQGGHTSPGRGPEIVIMDKEAYNAGEKQSGGLGIQTENRTPALRACGTPAVAYGFKAGQSADGGLGDEREVAPTIAAQPSALEPTVAIGLDLYNQAETWGWR